MKLDPDSGVATRCEGTYFHPAHSVEGTLDVGYRETVENVSHLDAEGAEGLTSSVPYPA
jgi:hypothetical protein